MPMYNQDGPAAYQQNQQGRQDDQFRQILQMMMMGMQQKTQQGQYADQMKQQQLSNEMAEKNYALDERNIASQEAYRNRPQTGELSSDAKTIEYLMAKGIVKTPQEGWQYLIKMKQGGISPSLAFNMGRKEIEDVRYAENKATNETRYQRTLREKRAEGAYKKADVRVRNELDKIDRMLAKDPYTLRNRPQLEKERDNLQKALDFITSAGVRTGGGMSPETQSALEGIVSNMPRVKSGDFLTDISEKLVGGTASQTPTGVPPEVKAYMKKHPEVPADEVMAMYTEYMKIKK